MILYGKIVPGLGEAKIWIGMIKSIFNKKFAMELFEGTLNIELNEEFLLGKTEEVILPEEYGGTQKVLVKKCKIFDKEAYILRSLDNETGKGKHNTKIIEIVSDINFREKYLLKNEDEISIIVE